MAEAEVTHHTCDVCGVRFATKTTDEEAWEEARRVLKGSNLDFEEMKAADAFGVVCDECNVKILAWLDSLTPLQRAELDRRAVAEARSRGVA